MKKLIVGVAVLFATGAYAQAPDIGQCCPDPATSPGVPTACCSEDGDDNPLNGCIFNDGSTCGDVGDPCADEDLDGLPDACEE